MAVSQEARKEIADIIIAAEAEMEFSTRLHPTNAKEQKEGFLSEKIEEPIFTYMEQEVPTVRAPSTFVESETDALYRDRLGHTRGLALLLQMVGQDREFSALSQVLFPVTDIGDPPVPEEDTEEPSIGAEEIVKTFRMALEECGLKGWKVEVMDGCSSRIFVNQGKKKLAVRADVLVTEKELAALTRHEVGVHVLRYAHGALQSEPLLRVGTLLGRLIEEGVACFAENPHGHLRLYERHLAVRTALGHSFRETWQELCANGCSPEDAWTHTLRVKRGITDGASRGAFTRDALYAQGFEIIRAFMDGGGKLEPLLSAPIHPEEITLLTEEVEMILFPLPPLLAN